jgi:hypothetical protein
MLVIYVSTHSKIVYCRSTTEHFQGEYPTAYMLRVTAVRTVHNLCSDIHVWWSPYFINFKYIQPRPAMCVLVLACMSIL